MFLYHPFMEGSVIFIKSIFNFLLFLIVDLRQMFCDFLTDRQNGPVQLESHA